MAVLVIGVVRVVVVRCTVVNRRQIIVPTGMDNSLQSWSEFYKRYFGITVDFSLVKIPDDPGGFDRIIFIPQGLKLNGILKAMLKALIKWWTFATNDDLDKAVTKNDRVPTQAYAIRCRERVEADEELKGLSANQIEERKIQCMTLFERAIYGLKYYSETGEHLDIVNWTLCAGSRNSDGDVPSMGSLPRYDKVNFDYCVPVLSDGCLRARQVVS